MLDISYNTFNFTHTGKIYAIGDIHGDIIPLIICLRDCCGVIKKKNNFIFNQNEIDKNIDDEMNKPWDDTTFAEDLNYEWCGGTAYVVFCGDILDNVRGPIDKKPGEYPFEEARIFKFINAINVKAIEKYGRLFKILGNHDMYNLNGKVKTHYSSFVSRYAQNYDGYKTNSVDGVAGSDGRLDYFGRGKPGGKLIGKHGAYLFLMINDFIFVHGGISSELISVNNLEMVNKALNKYINENNNENINENNNFDSETENTINSLTFSNSFDDGLVKDRFYGFVNGKTEEEMCIRLNADFRRLCKDKDLLNAYINQNNHLTTNFNQNRLLKVDYTQNKQLKVDYTQNRLLKVDYTQNRLLKVDYTPNKQLNPINLIGDESNYISRENVCNPDKMKLVIGHCNQNKMTSDKIFKSGFSHIVKPNDFIEEYTKPVFKGEPSIKTGIYGITVSCGDRDKKSNIDFNNPSIFRLDVGMSRGFNFMDFDYKIKKTNLMETNNELTEFEEYILSRTPQVLKINYKNVNDPDISVIKSSYRNTITHLTELYENPYKRKYNKYKHKYLYLKQFLIDNKIKI